MLNGVITRPALRERLRHMEDSKFPTKGISLVIDNAPVVEGNEGSIIPKR